MKKASAKRQGDSLQPEYDLSQIKGGVRGKYYRQAIAGTKYSSGESGPVITTRYGRGGGRRGTSSARRSQ